MLKLHLRIAFRKFWKDSVNSIVNLIGLTVGLTSVLLIFSYTVYEFSYDKSYSNAKNIYRVILSQNHQESVYVPLSLGPLLTKEYPEVETYTNCQKGKQQFTIGSETYEIPAMLADSNFFKVFNLKFKYGDPRTALENLNSIVIDESTANIYFPHKNPVGELLVDRSGTKPVVMQITGVINDIPKNTHFSINGITSALNEDPVMSLDWTGFAGRVEYLKFKDAKSIVSFKSKLPGLYLQTKAPKYTEIQLQPVQSIHLYTTAADDQFVNGKISNVIILNTVGLLILIIACINYVNLFTASSLKKVLEVGIRKVLGATRSTLIYQFIRESTLFFIIVIPFVLMFAYFLWPLFMAKLGHTDAVPSVLSLRNIAFLIFISLMTGLISGIYPALFISNLKPVLLIKNFEKGGFINLNIRKLLLVLQFVMSSFLIISTLFVLKQLRLISNIDLGFNKENLVILPIQRYDRGEGFLFDLKRNNNIKQLAVADFNLGDYYSNTPKIKDRRDTTISFDFAIINADVDIVKTLGFKLKEGRLFSKSFSLDNADVDSIAKDLKSKGKVEQLNSLLNSRPLIITDKVAAVLKIKKPLGQVINLNDNVRGTIVGIVTDIKGLSVHSESPLTILKPKNNHKYYGYMYIRMSGKNTLQTINFIKDKWKQYFPGSTFSADFADERLQNLYDVEYRQAGLFTIISFFAIGIACSGLFSLVSLILQQRRKEIGVRRILGSSIFGIVRLISSDFMKLIFISILVSVPLSWLVINKWLEGFAYRTPESWWIFAIGGCMISVIALATVSIQSIFTASAKPVSNMKG